MNIDNFVQSELRVVASENLDITSDLQATQAKNINELLINEKEKTKENTQEENNQKQ